METRKVKTMAEMASYYGVSEEDFRKRINDSKILILGHPNPPFDGELFYPNEQDKIFNTVGSPFQFPIGYNLEPELPEPTGQRINLNFSKTEVEELLKELVGVFAKNYNQPINLPFTNQEKS